MNVIHLRAFLPEFAGEYRRNGDFSVRASDSVFTWNLKGGLLVYRSSDEPVSADFSVDTIRTKFAFGNENDCYHYKVEGSFDVSVSLSNDFTQTREQGNNLVPAYEYRVALGDEVRTCSDIFAVVTDTATFTIKGMWGTRNDWWDGQVRHSIDLNFRLITDGSDDQTKWAIRIWGEEEEFLVEKGRRYYHQVEYQLNLGDSWSQYWTWLSTSIHREFTPQALGYLWELTPTQEQFLADMRWRADRVFDDGQLTEQAAKSVRLADINSIAYLKDFAELGSFAKNTVGLAGKFAKNKLKALASAYLAVHYGLKLTIKDTKELADSFDKIALDQMTQTLGAEKQFSIVCPGTEDLPVSVRARLTAIVNCWSNHQRFFFDRIQQCKHALYEYDATPSFENLWDLAPYTFVADWFLPIGDTLGRMELRNYAQSFDLRKAFYSRKFEWNQPTDYVTIAGNHVVGHAHFSWYTRECVQAFALPPLRVDSPSRDFDHWIEATALILAQL